MKRLALSILLIFGVILIGTMGYVILGRVPLLDGLYMTVITLTTVGYREVEMFTIFLIFLGVTSGTLFLREMARFVIEGEFQVFFRRQKSIARR